MKTSHLVFLLSLLGLTFNVNAIDQPKTLVFSAIPDQDQSQLKQRFSKIAVYLSKELGIPVRYIPVKSYAATVSAFRNNQVQLAWFGGLSGVRARLLVPGSTAIAQGAEDTQFKSYLIAHKSTGLTFSTNFPKTIEGKTLTFGSKGSTSGRLMPEFYIRQHLNKSPNEAFSRVGYSGNHSRTIALVQSGAYEIGAVNFKVWDKAFAAGKIDTHKVSIIWTTPTYTDYQWSIRGDVDKTWGAGFTDKVRRVLLAMKDPDLLAAFPRSKFINAENSDYDTILKTAQNIGLIDKN